MLHLLGDEADRAAIEPHLDSCAACREEIDRLRALLDTARLDEPPEPDAGFEARIWERQRAALARDGRLADPPSGDGSNVVRPAIWSFRRIAAAGAVAASLVVAFLVGLYLPPPGGPAPGDPTVEQRGGERVLLVAVGDHLERSRMVLLELVNGPDSRDLGAERAQARRLVSDNRLYRQTARMAGETAMADVLEELERVLLELAQSPDSVGAEELEWLRQRVADGDLLFKVKVIEGSARDKTGPVDAAGRSL